MRTGGLCSTLEAKGLCGTGHVWGVEAQVFLEADDAGGRCVCLCWGQRSCVAGDADPSPTQSRARRAPRGHQGGQRRGEPGRALLWGLPALAVPGAAQRPAALPRGAVPHCVSSRAPGPAAPRPAPPRAARPPARRR